MSYIQWKFLDHNEFLEFLESDHDLKAMMPYVSPCFITPKSTISEGWGVKDRWRLFTFIFHSSRGRIAVSVRVPMDCGESFINEMKKYGARVVTGSVEHVDE